MPVALTRQRSAPHKATKRPESPVKRNSSARLGHSGRSPSPFSPNTSHNQMPTHLSSESTAVLKPATPVRRRSARLSSASTKVHQPNGTANGGAHGHGNGVSGLRQVISIEGRPLNPTDTIKELDESPAKDVWSHPAPNGHASSEPLKTIFSDLSLSASPVEPDRISTPSAATTGNEVVRPQPASPPVKQKIDWEIPRKTLHSSIGQYHDLAIVSG